MLTGNIALLLRLLLFSLAGFVAVVPFASFDEVSGLLTIDLSGGAEYLVAAGWAAISGGTFTWSRVAKSFGGAT